MLSRAQRDRAKHGHAESRDLLSVGGGPRVPEQTESQTHPVVILGKRRTQREFLPTRDLAPAIHRAVNKLVPCLRVKWSSFWLNFLHRIGYKPLIPISSFGERSRDNALLSKRLRCINVHAAETSAAVKAIRLLPSRKPWLLPSDSISAVLLLRVSCNSRSGDGKRRPQPHSCREPRAGSRIPVDQEVLHLIHLGDRSIFRHLLGEALQQINVLAAPPDDSSNAVHHHVMRTEPSCLSSKPTPARHIPLRLPILLGNGNASSVKLSGNLQRSSWSWIGHSPPRSTVNLKPSPS